MIKQIFHNILSILPTKFVCTYYFFKGYKKLPNFKNPKYFGEKIQTLKMSGCLEQYNYLVDKYAVREYVKDKIGEDYLIPLFGFYDEINEIDFDKLPDKFVLKYNNGSQANLICTDKSKLDLKDTYKKLKSWKNNDKYWKVKKEFQYKNIQGKYLCEKNLSNDGSDVPDYKFYCFNGKVKFIEVDVDRYVDHKMNFYDLDWNLLDLRKGKYKNSATVERPEKLKEMIEISEKLSSQLPFARIDLYYIDNKIYFGEITLTPANGATAFSPIEKDLEIAKDFDLTKYPKREKLLYLGSVGFSSGRKDGVTVKSKILYDYLIKRYDLKFIDVDNYKKNFLKIIFLFFKYYTSVDKIVLCSSSPGASKILKFLSAIKSKKEIYYFVSGGTLDKKIEQKIYKIDWYKNIKNMYVESDKMVTNMKKLGLNNVSKIVNFRKFNPRKLKKRQDDEIRFVFWGRVIKEKGVEQAIELINRLLKDGYKVCLDIYGQIKNEYLEYLKPNFNDKIKYCGSINPNGDKEYEMLSEHDIFIFPTEHDGEGLPGALIDSYIAGLAVIASCWEYAHEYIEDNKNGKIFEYKNYEDMYVKTKELLDSNKLEEYKLHSLEMANLYDVDRVLKGSNL